MMRKIISMFLCLWAICSISIFANGSSRKFKQSMYYVTGNVIDKSNGEGIPFCTISVLGTTISTTADLNGHYKLDNLRGKSITLSFHSIGYKTIKKYLSFISEKTYRCDIKLESVSLFFNDVVVSANRNETIQRLSPSLVSVVGSKVFRGINAPVLSSVLNFQPGVRVENNCQNCGFTQVRMNGLGGAYSQILIDSHPIFSSLTGVYGLEQIPQSMISRVEVMRGGGSALYGSSSIAGTINIITKEPESNSAMISHTLTSIGLSNAFDNVTSVNASIVANNHKSGILLFGQKRLRSAYDFDGDGFSEIPTLDNSTLGFRAFLKTSKYGKINLEYHTIHEYRRGGDNLDKQPFEAYIAEQIETSINGGSIQYDVHSPDQKQHFNVYLAAQYNSRNSYYGSGDPVDFSDTTKSSSDNNKNRLQSYGLTKDLTYDLGTQYSYNFSKLWFMPAQLTGGAEFNYDALSDDSGYRKDLIRQNVNIASLYLQNEWKTDMWSFLIGGRADKHNMLKHVIFSPRVNIRYNPIPSVNMRLSYGQGFRAPQLFDEDLHVDIAQGKDIVSEKDPNLKEEMSHSVSASINWITNIGDVNFSFLLEGFYTKLLNPFTYIENEQPDGSIIRTITNSTGAQVFGTTAEIKFIYKHLIDGQIGFTCQRSLYDVAQKWSGNENDDVAYDRHLMRTPNNYGYMLVDLTPINKFTISLSGNYTGSMLVPHESGYITANRTDQSPDFFDIGTKFIYKTSLYKSVLAEFNLGIQNIFNAYQHDFDRGPQRASTYIYGPTMPRSIYAGIKLSI